MKFNSDNQGATMIRRFAILFVALCLAACQLPNRTDGLQLNDVPNLDPTLIPSNNGLLSTGITTVPGSYCFAGADGKCDPSKLSPAQCLLSGAIVEVAPKTNPTPSYDSLIDNKYAGGGNVPFVAATASGELYDEVKATIAGTALITPGSPNNGYPGIDGLRACILHNNGPGNYGTVYWISAANILDVTVQHFTQVSSTESVTATGFGLNGSTYNHQGVTDEKIWIGLQASPINVGAVGAAPPPAVAVRVLANGIEVRNAHVVDTLPAKATASFVR